MVETSLYVFCDNWRKMYFLHIFTISKIQLIKIPLSIPQSILYKRIKRAAMKEIK